MDKLSAGWIKRMSIHLRDHRFRFNEVRKYFAKIRLRQLLGHEIYKTQLGGILRVAHLTDQHVGRVTPMALQREAITMAMAQHPDLVVLTGDFVCHDVLFLDDLTEIIKLISCPVFAVLGNHDHWTNAEKVLKALKKGGAEVLSNAHTRIRINNMDLQIVGLDDAYTHHADVDKACLRMKKNIATLGLSHIAEEADKLWLKGVPMVLSGHTHAGQITVAGLQELILGKIGGHRYIHGFYGSKTAPPPKGTVYVSAGIGSAIMPLRMGEKGKREIAIFDLGA